MRGIDARAIAGEFDASLENIFPDEPGTTQPIGPDLTSQWKSAAGIGIAVAPPSDGFELEDFAVAARTLRDHVGEQISFAFADPAARLIAAELADGLDEAGYLRADLGEIAERLGAPKATCSPRSPSARPSIRPAFSRATLPNAWRCSSRRATGSIRPCGAGRQSRPAGAPRFRGACAASAASTRKTCST